MDYISRTDFLEREQNIYCVDCSRRKNSKGRIVYEIGDAPCRACGIGDVLGDIEDFPSADVEEVIRCKDCKYFNLNKWGKVNDIPLILAHEICDFWGEGCKTDKDAYCSFAERRDKVKDYFRGETADRLFKELVGERKTAKWEIIDEVEPRRYGCSNCKRMVWHIENFCPNCGAKMEG